MTDGSDGGLPVSGLHELLAQAAGRRSIRYASLEAARADPDAAARAAAVLAGGSDESAPDQGRGT
ncbi:hypothetical protein [Amnibacterium setariae]|nr:hypothetical protein [Amnibacterium setariae]